MQNPYELCFDMAKTFANMSPVNSGLKPKYVLKEHRTFRFDFGRQTGKTTFIKNTITDEDVLIVPLVTNFTLYKDIDTQIQSINQGINFKGQPNVVFFDDVGLMKDNKVEYMVNRLCDHLPTTSLIVLIG